MKVSTKSLELTIVTHNLLHRQPLSHPREDCAWVKEHFKPDIWGVQEAEDYTGLLKGIAGYKLAYVRSGQKWWRQDPILYNPKTVRLVSVKAYKMHGGIAHDYPPRFVYCGHFVDKFDGNHIYYYNTHVNQHIEDHHQPSPHPGHPTGNSKQQLATHHFNKMANIVEAQAKHGPSYVFWGGDLNVDEDADNKVNWKGFPNAIFKKHGMLSIFDELHTPAGSKDTHGGRKIDIIGSCKQDADVTGISVSVSPQLHSDHKAVRVVYRFPRKHASAGGNGGGIGSGTGDTVEVPLPVADVDYDFPDQFPVPLPDGPLEPILTQPVGTWDHSVCCRKQT